MFRHALTTSAYTRTPQTRGRMLRQLNDLSRQLSERDLEITRLTADRNMLAKKRAEQREEWGANFRQRLVPGDSGRQRSMPSVKLHLRDDQGECRQDSTECVGWGMGEMTRPGQSTGRKACGSVHARTSSHTPAPSENVRGESKDRNGFAGAGTRVERERELAALRDRCSVLRQEVERCAQKRCVSKTRNPEP